MAQIMLNNPMPTQSQPESANIDPKLTSENKKQNFHESLFFSFKNRNESVSNSKIIQKNSIYVIGITKEYATPQIIASTTMFGQFGPISVIEMKSCPFNHFDDYTQNYGAFITYENELSALMAICSLESGPSKRLPVLQASIGSNKVCKRFLKKNGCKIKSCTYYHGIPTHDEIITKNDDVSNFCMFEVHKNQGLRIALKSCGRLIKHPWPYSTGDSDIPTVADGIEFLNHFFFNGWTNDDEGIQHGLDMFRKERLFKETFTVAPRVDAEVPKFKAPIFPNSPADGIPGPFPQKNPQVENPHRTQLPTNYQQHQSHQGQNSNARQTYRTPAPQQKFQQYGNQSYYPPRSHQHPQGQQQNYYYQQNDQNYAYPQHQQMNQDQWAQREYADSFCYEQNPRNAYDANFYDRNSNAYQNYPQNYPQHYPQKDGQYQGYEQGDQFYHQDTKNTQFHGNYYDNMGTWDYEQVSQDQDFEWGNYGSNQTPNVNKGNAPDFSSNFSHSQPGYHTEGFSYQNTSADGNKMHTHMSEITIKLHKSAKESAKNKPNTKNSRTKTGQESQSGNTKSEISKVSGASRSSVKALKALKKCSEANETESTGSSKKDNSMNDKKKLMIEFEALAIVSQEPAL